MLDPGTFTQVVAIVGGARRREEGGGEYSGQRLCEQIQVIHRVSDNNLARDMKPYMHVSMSSLTGPSGPCMIGIALHELDMQRLAASLV